MSFFLYFATLKQIEGKIFKHIRVKGMKMRKEKKVLKDGCVWQAGPSWVVGQEAERGEGRPDETTSST